MSPALWSPPRRSFLSYEIAETVCSSPAADSPSGEDPRFAPETLAATYLDLHQQPKDQWQAELVHA